MRGDTSQKKIALVFTGDEFADGGHFISNTLDKFNIKGSFFLTGNFYRNPGYNTLIKKLVAGGNYMGSHSDKHLLYCDWIKRDSLLVTKKEFDEDLEQSYRELRRFDVQKQMAPYFLPPYEWYNDSIVAWTKLQGLTLVNFTPGTRSTADYTYPEMKDRYVSSKKIWESILEYERSSPSGLNGFILLLHIGTDPRRTDKFYHLLPDLLRTLTSKQYRFVRIDELLTSASLQRD